MTVIVFGETNFATLQNLKLRPAPLSLRSWRSRCVSYIHLLRKVWRHRSQGRRAAPDGLIASKVLKVANVCIQQKKITMR